MESPLPHVISTSELAPVNGNDATPFAQQTVVLTKQAYVELTWQAHYWRAQYEQLVAREAAWSCTCCVRVIPQLAQGCFHYPLSETLSHRVTLCPVFS